MPVEVLVASLEEVDSSEDDPEFVCSSASLVLDYS